MCRYLFALQFFALLLFLQTMISAKYVNHPQASINSDKSFYEYPLNVAVSNGHFDIVLALLKKGASPNEPDSESKYPIDVAVSRGYENIAQLLLIYKASPHELDNKGNPLLSIAVSNGHFDIVLALLKKGASPNKPDSEGEYPIDVAVSRGYKHIAQILLIYKAYDIVKTCITGVNLSIMAIAIILKELLQLLGAIAIIFSNLLAIVVKNMSSNLEDAARGSDDRPTERRVSWEILEE